jgi:hypothetical protein
MHEQDDDQQGSDDAATPEASPLQAVDLRLTCYRTLLLLPALLTCLATCGVWSSSGRRGRRLIRYR